MSNKAELWKLYQTAKSSSSRPSDLLCIDDRWTALQLDNAVALVGNGIEQAAQELVKRGSSDKPRWEPKYTMKRLLEPDFRLPPPDGATADPAKLGRLGGVISDEVD